MKSTERRKRILKTPVTEKQLQGFLKTATGQNEFVQRLAETLRQAWTRIQELEGEPIQDNGQQERDWQSNERILVISETDGTVEIYGEPWVTAKHLEVKPWDDVDDEVWKLGQEWRGLYESPKSKLLIVPQVRSELSDKALVDLARWERRVACVEMLLRLKGKP